MFIYVDCWVHHFGGFMMRKNRICNGFDWTERKIYKYNWTSNVLRLCLEFLVSFVDTYTTSLFLSVTANALYRTGLSSTKVLSTYSCLFFYSKSLTYSMGNALPDIGDIFSNIKWYNDFNKFVTVNFSPNLQSCCNICNLLSNKISLTFIQPIWHSIVYSARHSWLCDSISSGRPGCWPVVDVIVLHGDEAVAFRRPLCE